ncbi:hypothetical protein ZWY2020_059213 [Hordeum vulgare]|nr:hypothetical protein ZWY2020_059213 [Hordeum vulgare]
MSDDAHGLALALGPGAESSPRSTTVEVTRAGRLAAHVTRSGARAPADHVRALRRAGRAAPRRPPHRVRCLVFVRSSPFLPTLLFVSPAFASIDRGIELMPRDRPDPWFAAQACRADVVDGAIAYVRALEDTAAELEAHRAMSAGGLRAATGRHRGRRVRETSCFAVRLRAARPGALTRVLQVFQRQRVPVLAATVARNGGEAAVTVTTAVVDPALAGKIEADIISNA